MTAYRLSNKAAQDFETIFEFGIERFGVEQAIAYQNGLKDCFARIADNPALFQRVGNLGADYRRGTYGSHAIYYRAEQDFILIVRILGRQNPETAL